MTALLGLVVALGLVGKRKQKGWLRAAVEDCLRGRGSAPVTLIANISQWNIILKNESK